MKIPFIKAHGAGNDFVIIDKNVDFIKKSKKIIKKINVFINYNKIISCSMGFNKRYFHEAPIVI